MKKKNVFLIRFTVVAAMIGFFSPSVSVKSDLTLHNGYTVDFSQVSVSFLHQAEARGKRRSMNRGGNRARPRPSNRKINRNKNIHRNKNINRNINRNININRNVNVNHRYYGGYGHGYGYYGGRPILAFATGLAIGSIIASASMPSSCTTVVANGISYRRCGSSYYQPFYQGDTLVYKVVSSPY